METVAEADGLQLGLGPDMCVGLVGELPKAERILTRIPPEVQ